MGKKNGLPQRLPAEDERCFPNLIDYSVASPADPAYNCIAFAAGDTARQWDPGMLPNPGYYWPPGALRDDGNNDIDALRRAFAEFGFEDCADGNFEPGYRKVALYAVDKSNWQHAAFLDDYGDWNSKLGDSYDTERLIRKIFDNPEFMKRNVIAAEIEKVIDALTSLSFRRDDFLKSLDRFYRAIEDAAHTLEDFAEKQHFLNTVYERFFQGYSVKVADTHGIVYTPREIVDFMGASVEEVLHKEFNLTLGSKGVNILDPCTGVFII